jgi:hypothetical protein
MTGGKGTSTGFYKKFSEGAVRGSAKVLPGAGGAVVRLYYVTTCYGLHSIVTMRYVL